MRRTLLAWIAATVLGALGGSAFAHTHIYEAVLDGATASPTNSSAGFATSTLTLDLDLVTLRIEVDFSGLTGTTTAPALFGPTANPGTGTASAMTAALPLFPAGVSSGSYDQTLDLTVSSSYSSALLVSTGSVSNALNTLILALEDGKTYLNLPTTAFAGGEIRGFYTESVPAPEPNPALLAGLGGLLFGARRRRS